MRLIGEREFGHFETNSAHAIAVCVEKWRKRALDDNLRRPLSQTVLGMTLGNIALGNRDGLEVYPKEITRFVPSRMNNVLERVTVSLDCPNGPSRAAFQLLLLELNRIWGFAEFKRGPQVLDRMFLLIRDLEKGRV